jgi:hypothetical protein
VAVEPFLRGLVVVRVHDERAGRSGALGVLGHLDRVGGRVGARAGHDPDAAAGRLDHELDHAVVLVVTQGRRLAGGPAGDQSVGAVTDVEFDQLPELRLVDLAVPEGGDHRDE